MSQLQIIFWQSKYSRTKQCAVRHIAWFYGHAKLPVNINSECVLTQRQIP